MGGDRESLDCYRAREMRLWYSLAGRCDCRLCSRLDRAEKYYEFVNKMQRHSYE